MATKKTITEAIYKRHLRLYAELNDLHIFASRTVPLLKGAATNFHDEVVESDEDIAFRVPGKRGKVGTAKRNPTELKSLFNRFANQELYENLLVASVSRFEFYLSDVIGQFLRHAPKKLTIGPKGGDSGRQIPVQLLAEATDLDALYDDVIELRLQTIFHAEPKEYCTYFNAVSELGIALEEFGDFFEIKATRDLIVHNSLVVNELYLKKAGDKKRGELGEKLQVRREYFDSALSAMKTLSSSIERNTRAKHGKSWEKEL
jgi:hypothetical protein